MTWITGRKVTEVCADLATVIPVRRKPRGRVETFQEQSDGAFDEVKINTDDYGSVLLHFENSLRGVMTVSQVSAGRKARLWFEVDGSEGSLAWHSESPNVLWIGHRNEANQRMMKDPALMKSFLDKGSMTSLLQQMPVKIVLNDDSGIIGAARYTLIQKAFRSANRG